MKNTIESIERIHQPPTGEGMVKTCTRAAVLIATIGDNVAIRIRDQSSNPIPRSTSLSANVDVSNNKASNQSTKQTRINLY